MSFTNKVLAGLAAGVACGLFFGERIAPIGIVATGFVKLLQMTVLPYVVISIVTSLGSISFADARRLGKWMGGVMVALWAVGIAYAMLMPLAFPEMERASFFSTTLVEQRPPFNFVDLYIPSNPFHSLANNVVPAIVLFAVVLGVALIGVPGKEKMLDVLQVAMATVSRATRFVVKLTPYGIFAIAAQAAGTMSVEQVGRIEIYLITYVAVALLLALWVLPGLVAALTPIRYRDVLDVNKDALMTAFIAGDLFIVLPALTEACQGLLKKDGIGTHDEDKLPEVIVPASFNFPHTGKLLSLSFILFAGWFADATVEPAAYPQLAATGLLTFFGSLNAAVPFLLDLFRIPADTFQLFLATGVINSRFGSLLAAVHVITLALIGSTAIAGGLRLQPARLVRYGVVTLLLSAGTLGGLRVLFATVLAPQFEGDEIVRRMKPLRAHEKAVILTGEEAQRAPEAVPGGVIAGIRSRGVLRVGFFPNRMPFAFVNAEGELVGLDVEAAQILAGEFDVKARFIELKTEELGSAMATGRCDIIMTGAPVTPRRAAEALFSRSYMDETLGFVVRDHRRSEFTTWAAIRRVRGLRVAAPNVPHYLAVLNERLPGARIIPLEMDGLKLDPKADYDAYVLPAERGSFLTLLQPQFAVVVPTPEVVKIPLAYPVAREDVHWARLVDGWIELRQKDGTFQALTRHWIMGESAHEHVARWSVMTNVLGWGR